MVQDSKEYGYRNSSLEYYYQASKSKPKVYANGKVSVAKTVHDDYSLGYNLTGDALPEIIEAQIDAGHLPEDPHGVYFVLTSGDVTEQIRDGTCCQELMCRCGTGRVLRRLLWIPCFLGTEIWKSHLLRARGQSYRVFGWMFI